MVYAYGNCFTLEAPKLKRCKLDRHDRYQVILQNVSTKEVYVFKVRDLECNPIRFYLNVKLPVEIPTGEYNYFIISNDNWEADMIDYDTVRQTFSMTDKEAIGHDGQFIVFGDKILVTSFFKAKLYHDGKAVTAWDYDFKFNQKSNDKRVVGELIKYLDILGNGLLKYSNPQAIVEDVKAYKTKKTYKTYAG